MPFLASAGFALVCTAFALVCAGVCAPFSLASWVRVARSKAACMASLRLGGCPSGFSGGVGNWGGAGRRIGVDRNFGLIGGYTLVSVIGSSVRMCGLPVRIRRHPRIYLTELKFAGRPCTG